MEDLSHIPRQPEDGESKQSVESLALMCRDMLEEDKRYREQDKSMRVIAPEWVNNDGLHFMAYLKGTHVYSPDHHYAGQSFEIGLQVAYPVENIVPDELVAQAEIDEYPLPEPEAFKGLETHYSIAFTISPYDTLGWEEKRTYKVCEQVDGDDEEMAEVADLLALEPDENGHSESIWVTESQLERLISYRGAGIDNEDGLQKIIGDTVLDAVGFDIVDMERAVFLEFALQVFEMIQFEDEGRLVLARVFPKEIVAAIEAAAAA